MGSKSLKFLDDPKGRKRVAKRPDGRKNVSKGHRDSVTSAEVHRLLAKWGRPA